MASPATHALLSASAAHRWLVCTAAPQYEATFPDSGGTDYTREGTLAHSVCELCAQRKFFGLSTRKYNSDLKKLQASPYYKPEMLETADFYVSYLYEKCMTYAEMPHVSFEVRVDLSDIIPDGFGTCDCTIIGGDTLHITDYKHGQGVVVEAAENPQMMLYAYGALKRYMPIYGDSIKHVSMAIVQPRVTYEVKEYALTVTELIAWGQEFVKPRAQLAHEGKGEFVAGDHCRFCRGKEVCPMRAKQNTALEDFAGCVLPNKAENPLDPAARKILGLPPILTNAEIGDLLTRGKNLVSWYEDLQSCALQIVLNGGLIPGYKAVEGKSNRAFRDAEAAMATLVESGVDKDSMYDVKPKTLAQLEKLVGAKRFAELVGDQVFKPVGKPTLAVESDVRPVYSSASSDFAEVK